MVEPEDDDILISKMRSRSSSSNSQNDKLIAALQVTIIVGFIHARSPFALLHDQFNTWSEYETSRLKSLKVEKCTKTVRSGCIHNSNLSEKRHKPLQFKTVPGS